jgi:hypothetical protein
LGEGVLDRPEDTAVDNRGLIYTASHDGWIKRMHLNGSWEDWKMVGVGALGLTVSRSGDVLVCMPNQVRIHAFAILYAGCTVPTYFGHSFFLFDLLAITTQPFKARFDIGIGI